MLLPAFDVALGRLGKLDVGKATVVINDLHDLVVEHMASEYEAMGLDVPDKLEQLADGSRQALGCNAVDDYFKANTETKKPKQDVPSRLKLQQWRTSRVAAEAPAPAPVDSPAAPPSRQQYRMAGRWAAAPTPAGSARGRPTSTGLGGAPSAPLAPPPGARGLRPRFRILGVRKPGVLPARHP